MRLIRRAVAAIGVLGVLGAPALEGQRPDSVVVPRTTSYQWSGARLDSLPVDSLRTALGFVPGVSPGSRGDLYVRGGSPGGLVTYVDGVPVQPGVRGGGLGTSVGSITPWTGGLGSARLVTGPLSASFGNGTSGLLDLLTRSGGDRWNGGLRYSTDELSGKAASFGVNRVEGAVGGPIGRTVRLFAGIYVHGQQSATSGLDGADAPIFIPAGVDTTLAVPSTYGNPLADTSYVSVANWAVYRGNCSAFSGSTDPGIAGNYGRPCQGARIPYSANGSAHYQLRLDARADDHTILWFSALGGRDQARIFDYNLIEDMQAMTGVTDNSRVWTLGVRREMSPTVTGQVAVSLQHDQSEDGPLDPSTEPDTRDPFGGFLIAPLGLRWNLANFPVDAQLVTNYRDNIHGSRISPYDLSNTSQYGVIDQWRNDAYGLLGYGEGGGPTGRLSLYDETRVVGRATVEWRSPSAGTVEAGVEATHYDIKNYSLLLTSLIHSDVWIEKPASVAAYVTDRFDLDNASIEAGLRYQQFSTGAQRPWLLDTASLSPTFDEYNAFPRISTYGRNLDGSIATYGGKPLLQFRTDPAHTALSPSVTIGGRVNPRTAVHLALARQVQTPDFGESFSAINTDLQLTSTDQVFGSDLGFEDATLFEVAVTHKLDDGLTGSVTGYHRRVVATPRAMFTNEYDAATKATQDIAVIRNLDGGTTDGAEFRLTGHAGLVSGSVAYAYQLTSYTSPGLGFAPSEGDRPHSLTANATVSFPRGWRRGTSAGKVLEATSATVLARYASGARDYTCAVTTFVAPAAPSCTQSYLLVANGPGRLPSIKTVDLRLSRSFDVGDYALSFFIDAHNVFNFRNYTGAIGNQPNTSSALDEARVATSDSAGFASEARANGVYDGTSGSIDLTFGGAADPRTGCGAWVTAANAPASPNCVSLIRAEQRYGNGDGIFTAAEQKNASRDQYLLSRGLAALTDLPRRIRIGIEVTF